MDLHQQPVSDVRERRQANMAEEIEQRAYEIVEELRADIDFELDDVIAQIVRGLPEDYFTRLSRQDQLSQLKALLAMGVCNLRDEITLRSDDGCHLAVVARKNYPGLLAGILKRLPSEGSLIGAKIFTSTEHDFIIDLFEFKSNGDSQAGEPIGSDVVENTIEKVASLTGKSFEQAREFVSHYHPTNRILESPKDIAEQFLAFLEVEATSEMAVRWVDVPGKDYARVTVSAGCSDARELFQRTAEFLGQRSLDIEQAFLHDIPIDEGARMAIASFRVSGPGDESVTFDQAASLLADFLRGADASDV
jgi:UTP:GlnB (protein PII) uridylyltransferase